MSATETKERQGSLLAEIAAHPTETGIAVPEGVAIAVEAAEGDVTVGQVKVLQRTLCAKFSPDQLALYLAICHRKGVDPFTQAYGFPNSDGGLAFGLRIDGMRALAMRTQEYDSRTVETLWAPKEEGGKLIGARCTVKRLGMSAPVVEEAWMAEYDRGGLGWKQFPETMIRKVAESKALRAAFPDALGGFYEPAELGGGE